MALPQRVQALGAKLDSSLSLILLMLSLSLFTLQSNPYLSSAGKEKRSQGPSLLLGVSFCNGASGLPVDRPSTSQLLGYDGVTCSLHPSSSGDNSGFPLLLTSGMPHQPIGFLVLLSLVLRNLP